eukprot:1391793-Amorphochlora_amoeboformis.AAC.1
MISLLNAPRCGCVCTYPYVPTPPSLAVRSFKIQMLSALGEVRAYTEDEPDQPPKVLKHERVYEAPWNGNPLWHDWALVGGPVQLFFGERVNRLSMSSIVVNREPLKMYK